MFWRMPRLSAASPVDNILDKENCTLEELLDEDEIIQECKALNERLINFLRARAQVEQLLRYIVEEAPDEADKKHSFKFPFVACEIFTCEVDNIFTTLIEDEELMDLLFSFLKPNRPHSTMLAGYFGKVVFCLMMRRTTQLMSYIQGHPEIFHQLVDLIGITSIMEVLIRLIGADENMYSNYSDALQLVDASNLLDLVADKFSTSDSPEVHANAAEFLCAVTRYAPSGLAAKICSPSFVGRLFRHALDGSRPKSVLVHSLSVCISLLDPKRLLQSSYQSSRSQLTRGTIAMANPETVAGMLESLGDLLKLLDYSTSEEMLPTTYGCLKPPLGKHRLKVVEFISILFTLGSEDAENELIRVGSLRYVMDLFFAYPYNNVLHHQVENIISSCLESKRSSLFEHLLHEYDIVSNILEVEKLPILLTGFNKPTVPAPGRSPPKIGHMGHLTRISNKLVQAANANEILRTLLQENTEWTEWYSKVLVKRNALENIYSWACGRPTSVHDRVKDSDDEEFRDRDYDVAALASNLSQAFRFNIHGNEDIEEAHGSRERDNEDVYFDNESAEVLISSLRLGDDQDSSLFTNSNWFALEDDRVVKDHSTSPLASPSANSPDNDEVVVRVSVENDNNPASMQMPSSSSDSPDSGSTFHVSSCVNVPIEEPKNSNPPSETEKPPEWIEWREIMESGDLHDLETINISPNQSPESDVVAQIADHSLSPENATSILNSSKDLECQVKPDPDESEQK